MSSCFKSSDTLPRLVANSKQACFPLFNRDLSHLVSSGKIEQNQCYQEILKKAIEETNTIGDRGKIYPRKYVRIKTLDLLHPKRVGFSDPSWEYSKIFFKHTIEHMKTIFPSQWDNGGEKHLFASKNVFQAGN